MGIAIGTDSGGRAGGRVLEACPCARTSPVVTGSWRGAGSRGWISYFTAGVEIVQCFSTSTSHCAGPEGIRGRTVEALS